MSRLEETGLGALTRVVGEQRADRLAGIYRDRALPSVERLTYAIDRRGRRSRSELREIAGKYKGERCFIIGNGPSLANTDLALLRDQHTFALNRGYLLFDRLGGPSTFLVAVNQHVIRQFSDELLAAGSRTFMSWKSRRHLPKDAAVTFVRRRRRFTFAEDVSDGAWEGATVTYLAMQLAFHLGFTEVVLVGVDHSFASKGKPNQLVTATEADRNHFDPNYFGPGVQWQLPDLDISERAYVLARDRYATAGRTILDATVGGKLTVFPKTDLAAIVQPADADLFSARATGSGDRPS